MICNSLENLYWPREQVVDQVMYVAGCGAQHHCWLQRDSTSTGRSYLVKRHTLRIAPLGTPLNIKNSYRSTDGNYFNIQWPIKTQNLSPMQVIWSCCLQWTMRQIFTATELPMARRWVINIWIRYQRMQYLERWTLSEKRTKDSSITMSIRGYLSLL